MLVDVTNDDVYILGVLIKLKSVVF